MAKGDYILFNNVPFQSVDSVTRRYGVMFDPSSSRSRLRIRDSGRRYAVRLNVNGVVEYSIEGDAHWQEIDSLADPCTGQKLPKIVTYENLRIGEALNGIVFDMIAVGRGRVIAKEAGTDRLYHLYMGEMFRTFQRDCNPGETNAPPLDEDPPIPPFNMKIDPEYFTDAAPTVVVPPEATRGYSHHPASLRLPVFNQLLELDVADVMLMMERARTWYYKDNRSQLAITTQDDLAFTEQDVKDVFTQPVIKDILESIKSAAMEMQSCLLAKLLILGGFQPDSIATDWRNQLERDGLLVLVFPAYAALGALLWGANASKGFKRDPATGAIKINLPTILNFLNQPMPNPTAQRYVNEAMAKFNEAIAELMLRSRRGVLERYGARPDVRRKELPDEWTIENKLPTPNQPPSWMPTVIRTTYTRSKSTGQETWRKFYGDEVIKKVCLGTNADGRLEAFGLDGNNAVWHTVQADPSGDWKGSWELLHTDKELRTQLVVARNTDGRLELFGLDSDGHIWHTLQKEANGDWDDGWQQLYSSNDKLKTIAVVQNSDGRLELLGVGSDDQVWRTFQKTPGTWVGNWEPIGPGKRTKVWPVSNENGSLEAFSISSDDKVWNMVQSKPGETWSGTWTPFYGDDKLRTLAIGRNANGQLEIIGVAADQRVWRTAQTAKNGPWLGKWEEHYPNGQHLTDVWMVSHLDGRLEAFGLLEGFPHLNDTVWHTWQVTPNENWNGSWVQITADGGRQDLAVALNSDGHVEIIGIIPGLFNHASVIRMLRVKPSWHSVWKKFFTDGDLLHKVWLETNADGRLEAFGLGPNNTVWNTSQQAPNGQWNPSWDPIYGSQDARVQLATGRNSDGRLELFSVTPDNRVFRTSQSNAGKDWNKTWVEVYKSTEKHHNLCVGTNADGRLELFGTSPGDNRVWHTWQTVAGDSTKWKGSWEELYQSSDQRSTLAVARNLDGRLQLFGIRPSDNTIWHTSQVTANGDWDKTWVELYHDDDKLSSIVAGRNQDGRLEVFGVAPDNRIWHTWQTTPGKDWLGGWVELYSPRNRMNYLWLVTNNDGRLELFGIKSDLFFFWENRVYHTWQTRPGGPWNGAWVEVEADGGRRTMAVAPNVDGRIEVIGITPPIVPSLPNPPEFPDDHVWNTRLLAEHRYAIQYSKVLDIGIGSSHWSENWQAHFGGEIHSLLQHRPLFQGERYSLIQYRFLNGPVIDGDAFNDGTTNFYMMVKLGPPGATGVGYLQKYAILWFDEQTYFTTRWRLLHPTDDTLGDLFSLSTALRNNPEWFDFHLARYWCPFRADFIDDDSRMIVRRNVVVVTGKDPVENRHEIYTIVFNYGLCDHSWRWRKFPEGKQVTMDRMKAQDQDPQLPAEVSSGTDADAYIVVNTTDLRDDTMLHVRGSLRLGGALQLGRWVQRYLPADCQHVPERHALNGRKPALGYSHPWDFISENAFKRADQFYQFGVYEDLVDSRAQYYEVDLLPGANGVTPPVTDVIGHVWRNDSGGLRGDQLKHNTINFVWDLPKENGVITKRISDPDNPLSPELFVHEFRNRSSMSMYEPTTRFRILERKPLGLIAVFYDKRDDELQAASDLPQPTTFVQNDDVETGIPDAWKTADGETKPLLPRPQPPSISVMVKSNKRVYQPPNVRKAWLQVDKAPGLRRLHVSFWTPQMEHEVNENIWRVSLAAIDETGQVVPLFSVLRLDTFVRRAVPQAPLPLGFRGELGDEWRYDWAWDFDDAVKANVRRFCTPEGHVAFATSLWFEDIVGHRAIAEQIIFEPLAQDLGAQDLGGVIVDGLPATPQ